MASELAFRMREDGYLMQINQLRDERDKLRKENERLRAEQVYWELGNCPSCPNVASLQEALEQNSNLRVLVDGLRYCAKESHGRCAIRVIGGDEYVTCCPLYDTGSGQAKCESLMRNLGIEVR